MTRPGAAESAARVLVRARGLAAFRQALADRALSGSPLARRRRLVILPSRAAADVFRQTLEDVAFAAGHRGVILPDLLTREAWLASLHAAVPDTGPFLSRIEQEILFARAVEAAAENHPVESPLVAARPGLVAAMLDFYDELRRRLRTPRRFVHTLFRELAVERGSDRGSESLIQQTRLFGFAFLAYERAVRASGAVDEHVLRERLLAAQPVLPFDHVIIAVADHPADPRGLWPSDFDLLGRLRHLSRVEIVVTDEAHDAGFRERLEAEWPGVREERAPDGPPAAELVRPADGSGPAFVCRDREEELRGAARLIRARADASGGVLAESVALVFQRPLPYLYLGEHVLADAGVPYQAYGALPLAAEPYAALVDLVLQAVRTGGSPDAVDDLARAAALDVSPGSSAVGATIDEVAHAPSAAAQIEAIAAILRRSERPADDSDPWVERFTRGRRAVLGVLDALAGAFARFDGRPRTADDLTAAIRHALEARTFAPRRGGEGVALVDAVAARFGAFDHVHLVGLVEHEWPGRSRRSPFYAVPLLKALGWPQEADQMRADQAAFRDLLQLGRRTTRLSAFQLEGDAIVGPSSMLALVPAGTGQEATRDERRPIFADELLTEGGPVAGLDDGRSRWLALRRARPALSDGRYGGYIEPRAPQPYRVSRVDRYVDCPFKYFAETVLGLDEEREQAAGLSPLERGTLVHTLFERFYAEWQRRGERAITPAVMSEALELFRALADDALAPLADADRALERARLFGSIVGMGVAERVFELEAERGADVAERRLEMVLNGTYGFPRLSGVAERPIEIRGTADRVDVLADGSLAIVDYKLGRMPDLSASIQIAVYAHAAGQMLERADGRPHPVAFASYLAFGDDRRLEGQLGRPGDPVPIVVRSRAAAFAAAVERIESGAFPARPRHASDCQWCGYAGVCRKEYRSDEHEAAGPA